MAHELPARFVAYEDFLERARQVLPDPVFTYLESGIGHETGLARNRADLDAIVLTPRTNGSPGPADPSTRVLGQQLAYPFAVAPVGLPGLMCPGAELALARACVRIGVPFTLSTVASASLEEVAAVAGRLCWFQLYPAQSDPIRNDLIDRAAASGCEVLMVTVDIPVAQRRERSMRSGLHFPVRLGPLLRAAPRHPRWVLRMLRGPRPTFASLTRYGQAQQSGADFRQTVHQEITQPVGAERIAEVRARWPGRLLVKGVLDPRSAADMVAAGADGIVVSNHGGRQLDAAPSPVQALPRIREAVGAGVSVLADSGATSGLDVLRLLRMGADTVLLGRYPYAAVAACGTRAARPALDILCHQIGSVMMQLGIRDLAGLDELLVDVRD